MPDWSALDWAVPPDILGEAKYRQDRTDLQTPDLKVPELRPDCITMLEKSSVLVHRYIGAHMHLYIVECIQVHWYSLYWYIGIKMN